MSELSSKFTPEDIETLIEAMGDWESVGNQEFHVLNMIKSLPIPPEDHESHELVIQIKDHFKKREREIHAGRIVRQEKSIFLKAKLMLVRKDCGINTLFDMAAEAANDPSQSAGSASTSRDSIPWNEEHSIPIKSCESLNGVKLALAEEFIKDLGVWSHYEKFLIDKSA